MITVINESKSLTNHILFEYKCKFDGTKPNSNQWWNKKRLCLEIKRLKRIIKRITKRLCLETCYW